MTQEQKILAVVGLLPVLADLLEDVELFRNSKKYANLFLNKVRRVDNVIIKVIQSTSINPISEFVCTEDRFLKIYEKY